jgi:tRNA pseudouridine38-40 synthase
VRVTAATEESATFHARHSARARRYRYRLLAAPELLAERYAWAPPELPPIASLAASAVPLTGEHDCTAFQTVSRTPSDPVCRVYVARWSPCQDGAEFEVVADHFLYHMVRNLVGTSIAAAKKPDPGAHMHAVLDSRDRRRRASPAPPHGLSLEAGVLRGRVLVMKRAGARLLFALGVVLGVTVTAGALRGGPREPRPRVDPESVSRVAAHRHSSARRSA